MFDEIYAGKKFITIKELVATGFGSRAAIERLLKLGELQAVRVGRSVIIPRYELERYVAEHPFMKVGA